MRLQGKTILITATGQGIEHACAEACVRDGANVIATDLDLTLLAGLNDNCHSLDVMDAETIAALAAQLSNLDGQFNCARFVANGTVLDLNKKDWDFSFGLIVKAIMRACRAFLHGMLLRAEQTGTALILNMASSNNGFENRTAYGASTAAVIGLIKTIAADFVKTGLRCNAISSGTVDTPSFTMDISTIMALATWRDGHQDRAGSMSGLILKDSGGAMQKALAFGSLVALVLVFSVLSGNFRTIPNMMNILQATLVIGVLAVSATILIITGGIDIAVGTAMTFTALTAGMLLTWLGLPIPVGVVGAILMGAVIAAPSHIFYRIIGQSR